MIAEDISTVVFNDSGSENVNSTRYSDSEEEGWSSEEETLVSEAEDGHNDLSDTEQSERDEVCYVLTEVLPGLSFRFKGLFFQSVVQEAERREEGKEAARLEDRKKQQDDIQNFATEFERRIGLLPISKPLVEMVKYFSRTY